METQPADAQNHQRRVIAWWEVHERIAQIPDLGKFYGIPRGGLIVAGLSRWALAVNDPEEADYFVDDIIDSGKTRDFYTQKYGKPFFALVDKKKEGIKEWVQFPWELEGERDIEDTVVRQLEFIGEDPTRAGLKDTPRRVIRALQELTTGYGQEPAKILATTFTQTYDEMVVVEGIEFWSMCEHHLKPFRGVAHIGYLPNGSVVGLSKIHRLVECFARRLQIQERMTTQIAEALMMHLKPYGVGVVLKAEHTCVMMRGVKNRGWMKTSCLLGDFRKRDVRAEFFNLIK